MKTCMECKYAEWDKTKKGRLHPSGDGHCKYTYKVPRLPMSMYWIGKRPPTPSGGSISRREQLRGRCPYYEK